MKKFLSLLVAFIMIFVVTACSSSSDTEGTEETSESSDTNKITVWAWDPNFNIKALEIAKEYYAEENPDLEVEIITSAQEDIVQKLNTSLSSGTTKGLPNIVLMEDYRAQSFLTAYPDSFHKITGSFNTEDFAPYKLAPTSVDGENYGLPFDTGATGLYVRTDYLEQAGYTVEDLTDITWDEYIEIGKVVKEKTGYSMLSLDSNDIGNVRYMMQSAGLWYYEEDGVTPFITENPALKEAFEIYKKMADADLIYPSNDWASYLAAFNGGNVATVPTGNWITASIKAEASQSGKWAVTTLPRLSTVDGAVNASNLGGSSWYVLNVDGKDEATDFLAKTFGSNVDFYQDLITDVSAIGTYSPAAGGDAYQIEDEYFGGQKIIADFAEWSNNIPSVNYGANTYAVDDIVKVELQNYLNGKELDQALQDAQAQVESSLQ